MKSQATLYLEDMTHREGKKRAIDLGISFSDYVAALILCELKNKTLDGVDVQKLIDGD